MFTLLTAYAEEIVKIPNELGVVPNLETPIQALGFITIIANWIFAILISVAVIYVLLAAFQYLTSKGGEGVQTAHKMLLYAAVAIAVAVLARGFVIVTARIAGRSESVKFIEPTSN